MSDEYRADLASAVQMLAADNARLCDRLIAAEKVVAAVERFLHHGSRTTPSRWTELQDALDAYDAGKPS